MAVYVNLRSSTTPSQDIVRNMDTCTAVTKDLVKLMRELSSEANYDEVKARKRMNKLFTRDYARSLGGTTISSGTSFTSRSASYTSESSNTLAKRKELVEQLAVKKAEIEMEPAIEAQRRQLKSLERLKEVKIIEARLRVHDEDMNGSHRSKFVLGEEGFSYLPSYIREN